MCNENIVDEWKYRGYNVRIYPDELDCETPRDWDCIGKMICFHKKYDLGDKHDYDHPSDFLIDLIEGLPKKEVRNFLLGLHGDWTEEDIQDIKEDPFCMLENSISNAEEDYDKCLEFLDKHYIILPLYLYDHGDITMSVGGFSCPWDSGQVGWIYISKKDLKKEFSKKRMSHELHKQGLSILESEVITYDQHLTGEVYGYNIEKYGEHVASCWGFYGDPKGYMYDEIKSVIDYRYDIDMKEINEIHKEEIGEEV